jgi:hypothetical protein
MGLTHKLTRQLFTHVNEEEEGASAGHKWVEEERGQVQATNGSKKIGQKCSLSY